MNHAITAGTLLIASALLALADAGLVLWVIWGVCVLVNVAAAVALSRR